MSLSCTRELVPALEVALGHAVEEADLGVQCRFGVWGLGFRVQVSGFRVQGSGFRVQGLGFRV